MLFGNRFRTSSWGGINKYRHECHEHGSFCVWLEKGFDYSTGLRKRGEGENLHKFRGFSLRNLGRWCPLVWHEWAICESFLCENCIFHHSRKFSSLKVPTIWYILRACLQASFDCIFLLCFCQHLYTHTHTHTHFIQSLKMVKRPKLKTVQETSSVKFRLSLQLQMLSWVRRSVLLPHPLPHSLPCPLLMSHHVWR